MEKIVCDLCGKDDFKTERGLEMHKRNCKGNTTVTEVNKEVDEVIEEVKVSVDTNPFMEEVKAFIDTIKASKVTLEQIETLINYYEKITGNTLTSRTCSSCISHAFTVVKLNVKHYEKTKL